MKSSQMPAAQTAAMPLVAKKMTKKKMPWPPKK